MNGEEALSHFPERIRFELRRERLKAQGRYDAFVFVQECGGDIACLKEKIEWYEELMTNPPDDWKGPMAPSTSVRLHKEGYLPGLKDALKILLQAEQAQLQAMTRVAEAPTPYHVTRRSAPPYHVTRRSARTAKKPHTKTNKTKARSRRKQKGTS